MGMIHYFSHFAKILIVDTCKNHVNVMVLTSITQNLCFVLKIRNITIFHLEVEIVVCSIGMFSNVMI